MGNQVTNCCLQRAFNVFRLLRVKKEVYEYHFVEQIANARDYQPVEINGFFRRQGTKLSMRAMLQFLCPDLHLDAPTIVH